MKISANNYHDEIERDLISFIMKLWKQHKESKQ
jgi:hypothetical protein